MSGGLPAEKYKDGDKDMTTIDELTSAIHELSPKIPLNADLWSSTEIASYLKRSERSTMEKVVILPGFPQAIRIPTPTGGHARPLWKAKEVIEWVERYQEKRVA